MTMKTVMITTIWLAELVIVCWHNLCVYFHVWRPYKMHQYIKCNNDLDRSWRKASKVCFQCSLTLNFPFDASITLTSSLKHHHAIMGLFLLIFLKIIVLNIPFVSFRNWAQIEKIDQPWPKFNQVWRRSGCIWMLNFVPFLPCIPNAQKTKFDNTHWVKSTLKSGISTNRDQNLFVSEAGQVSHHAKLEAIPFMRSPNMPQPPTQKFYQFH